ncbi:hypothetical protein, partial [Bacillus pumilus]|uniref:hypothetical protein n=1 Tax=Bacillus pumilus TaxID=1408 RepID=UPI003D093302
SSRFDNMFIPHRIVLLPLLYKKACRLCLQAEAGSSKSLLTLNIRLQHKIFGIPENILVLH